MRRAAGAFQRGEKFMAQKGLIPGESVPLLLVDIGKRFNNPNCGLKGKRVQWLVSRMTLSRQGCATGTIFLHTGRIICLHF
jgi:hypothetical protein